LLRKKEEDRKIGGLYYPFLKTAKKNGEYFEGGAGRLEREGGKNPREKEKRVLRRSVLNLGRKNRGTKRQNNKHSTLTSTEEEDKIIGGTPFRGSRMDSIN